MRREDVVVRCDLVTRGELGGARGGGSTMVGGRDKTGGGNMYGEAGHKSGGNILRYETRRVNTGW